MVDTLDPKTKNGSQTSVFVTSGKPDENLTKFMQQALALGAKKYLNSSEEAYLKNVGSSLGLPSKTIDDVIKTISLSNSITLKELTQKVSELRGLKNEQAHLTMNSHNKTGLLQDQPHAASLKNAAMDDPALPNDHQAGNQSILNAQFQSSISSIQNEIGDLKQVTGGEGDNHRLRKNLADIEKKEKVKTDKSQLPLIPIVKKFTYDR